MLPTNCEGGSECFLLRVQGLPVIMWMEGLVLLVSCCERIVLCLQMIQTNISIFQVNWEKWFPPLNVLSTLFKKQNKQTRFLQPTGD